MGALALHVSLLLVTPVDKAVPNQKKRERKKSAMWEHLWAPRAWWEALRQILIK